MKLEEKLVHNIISSTVTLHYIEQLSHTPYYNKQVKYFGNKFKAELLKVERSFNEIEDLEDDCLNQVYNVFYDFLEAVASVEIPETGELLHIITAYRKNKKSILGIADKILK